MPDLEKIAKLGRPVPVLLFIGYLALTLTAVRVIVAGARGSRALFSELAESSPSLSEGVTSPFVTFVFNVDDCPACLRLGRYWNVLHESGVAQVNGVMIKAPRDPEAVRAFLANRRIEFPVDAEPDERLLSAVAGLGYDTTPVTILFDRRRRPRLILPPLRDSVAQLQQADLVKAQLDQLSGEQTPF